MAVLWEAANRICRRLRGWLRQTATDPQEVGRLFFDRANQYYIVGRFSILCQLSPVGMNLLHHAVEMYLKGALARKLSLGELRELRHGLRDAWKQFKIEFSARPLDAFDSAIQALDRFEELRYPNSVLKKGMSVQIARSRGDLVRAKGNARRSSRYELSLEEIDKLVKTIFDTTGVSPSFFQWPEEAAQYLRRENKHPLF